MKTPRAILLLALTIFLGSCETDTYTITVAWPPGKVRVPRCGKYSPIVHLQTAYQIQGVTIPIPQAGTSVSVGGVKIDPQTAQSVSEAIGRAEVSYTQLCSLLPTYVDDKNEFDKTRNQMRDIISGFYQTAYTVADVTGQPKPAPPVAPAASPSASAAPGASTIPAVPVAPTPVATPTPAASQTSITARGKDRLRNAAAALNGVAKKATQSQTSAPRH